MNNDWYEGAARELSFFTTTEIIKAYTSMQKKYGIAFYSVLFHSKKGVLRMIRKKSELNAIIDFIEHQSEEFVIGQFKKALSLYEKLKKALQKKALTQGKFQKVISLCEELWAYNMFCIYFTYATERKRVKEISGRNYALVAKVRNEICTNDKEVHEDIDLAIHIKKYGEIFFEPNVVVKIPAFKTAHRHPANGCNSPRDA